jgi:hypothetical protein
MEALAPWYGHVIGVHRLTGSGAGVDVFTPALDADPDDLPCFVNDGTKLVRDQNGNETLSTAQVAHPPVDASGAVIERVPPGSVAILPPVFGSRQTRVIACALGDAGDLPVPSHYELALE